MERKTMRIESYQKKAHFTSFVSMEELAARRFFASYEFYMNFSQFTLLRL